MREERGRKSARGCRPAVGTERERERERERGMEGREREEEREGLEPRGGY